MGGCRRLRLLLLFPAPSKCNLLPWPQLLYRFPPCALVTLAPGEGICNPVGISGNDQRVGTTDLPLVLRHNGVEEGSLDRLLVMRASVPPVNCGRGAGGGMKQ